MGGSEEHGEGQGCPEATGLKPVSLKEGISGPGSLPAGCTKSPDSTGAARVKEIKD